MIKIWGGKKVILPEECLIFTWRRGRPKKRWMDCVKEDMRIRRVDNEMTADKGEWMLCRPHHIAWNKGKKRKNRNKLFHRHFSVEQTKNFAFSKSISIRSWQWTLYNARRTYGHKSAKYAGMSTLH
ncbi:jg23745, partial [Pararge aegeria aegeria]